MSKFPDWFNRAYKRWSRSQPGEEDFLAFCDLLGYSPATILSWLQGNSIPQDAEVLSISGMLGIKVYEVLGQLEPDPGLMEIFNSFSHLKGENRIRLALYEAELIRKQQQVLINSHEFEIIIDATFKKWGVLDSRNQ